MTSDAKLPTEAACPICSMSHVAGRWCSAPYERSPLAEEINELPERLRSWIHHLETDADPAGTLRENFVLREAVAALGAKVEKAEAQRDRVAEATKEILRRFKLYCQGMTDEQYHAAVYLSGGIGDAMDVVADIEKENA